MRFAYLADFYGELLDEHTRAVIMAYYDDDLSLSEIAKGEGISRQGVRDLIKKAEEELFFYEKKLGLAKKFEDAQKHAEKALALCKSGADTTEIENEIKLLLETVG
jgi:predicted DNA-binding protein YlxM (UPF0122 family)